MSVASGGRADVAGNTKGQDCSWPFVVRLDGFGYERFRNTSAAAPCALFVAPLMVVLSADNSPA